MFELNSIAKWLIVMGLGVVLLGTLLFLLAKIPGLDQIGHLPGNFRWQSADGRFSCLVPITSALLLSVILTILVNIIVRLRMR